MGILYLVEPDGHFRIHTAAGYRVADGARADGFFGHPELLDRAHREDVPVSVPSAEVPESVAKDFLGQLGLLTALIVPVKCRDESLGALLLASNARDVSGDDWRGFAQVVSGQLGQAVTLSRAFERMRWLTLATDQSPTAVILTDAAGNIQYVNDKFSEMSGYMSAQAVGRNPRMLRSGKTPERTYRELWTTISAGGTWHGELENRRKDGTP